MLKRCAIVGTAPSWIKTPFDDPSLEIWSLNDAWVNNLPRISRWYEQHPLGKLWFRPKAQKVVYAHQVPPGHYVRPEGHLEMLQQMAKTIPVFLQDHPPTGWPVNAQRFPLEAVEAKFGAYWASGPSYMLAQALIEGYREIHIYGIHLSTEEEYIHQRPNFEHFLGIARGMGVTIIMADESPVLKHGWKYAYEPKPQAPVNPLLAELQEIKRKQQVVIGQLVNWPRFKSKAERLEKLRRLEAAEIEVKQRMASLQGSGTVTAQVVAA
jgi:hypothetical protein